MKFVSVNKFGCTSNWWSHVTLTVILLLPPADTWIIFNLKWPFSVWHLIAINEQHTLSLSANRLLWQWKLCTYNTTDLYIITAVIYVWKVLTDIKYVNGSQKLAIVLALCVCMCHEKKD